MFIKSETVPKGYKILQPKVLANGRSIVTSEQRLAMKDLYENHGLSTWKIGKAMGYLNVCVINNLKKVGVKMRNRSDANKTILVDRTYFDKIDSPTKAYILGFIYADGNIHKDSFTIALQERDGYILEKTAKEIGYDGKISFRKRQRPQNQDVLALRVHDFDFAESLRKLGVVERKTSKLFFPKFLDRTLTYSFLHGLLDGNGCVVTRNQGIRVEYAGAEGIMLNIQKIIMEDLGLLFAFDRVEGSRGTKIRLTGSNAIQFLQKIYSSGSKICLFRKYDKLTDYLKSRMKNFKMIKRPQIAIPFEKYEQDLKQIYETSHSFTD